MLASGNLGSDLAEMASAVSEIFATLDEFSLAQETLSIFMSDHGPHREMCMDGGDAGPFKGMYRYILRRSSCGNFLLGDMVKTLSQT